MKDFNIALASISFLLLTLGLVYKKIKRSVLSEPIIALASGILLGPYVLQVLDMKEWGSFEMIMEVATKLTISMGLMATAFRIPKTYIAHHIRLQSVLILAGMLGMCAMATLLLRLIFGYDWLLCLLIGAVITPTDPVVASTIVSGEAAKELLPGRVRHAISFESGANDGMAFPLVFLPLLFIQKPGHALQEWLLKSILWETIGGVAIGLLIGFAAAKALRKAKEANWMAKPSLLIFSVSLALFVLGLLEMVNSNGIIGVFAAGLIANYELDKDEDIEQEQVQEAMERIFIVPIFVLFGLILPWQEWLALSWKAVWIVVAILLLRRLPVILALKPVLSKLPKWADLFFVGWFGPIGVAAMFYAVHSLEKVHMQEVWVVASLIIFGSTLLHGFTAYPITKLYHRSTGEPVQKKEK